jgi:hypothetical protein
VRLAVLGLVLCAGCRCQPAETPAGRIEALLAPGHGPLHGPREPLDEVRRDFGRHRELVRRELTLPTDLRELDPAGRRLHRTAGALAIASYAGAHDLVLDTARRLRPYLEEVWRHPSRPGPTPPVQLSTTLLFQSALADLGRMRHPGFVGDAFAMLPSTVDQPAARIVLLDYLAAVADVEPTILPRLRALDDLEVRQTVQRLERKEGSGAPRRDR